jgi:hypothetical protein
MKYTAGQPLEVQIGQQSRVELPPRVLRARLTGVLFETAKTFVLPSAMHGIRQLVRFYNDHPGVHVLVSGHTDTQGPADYNRGLSMERAEAVKLYLVDDAQGWMKWYRGQPCSNAWGVREDQLMMSTVQPPFYHGTVDGKLGSDTRDAYKALQKAEGLKDTGTPDEATRKALVTRYMKLDGTTLPTSAPRPDSHGCGLWHLEVQTGPNVDEPRNRRVEIFLFEGNVDPPPQKLCPWNGCAEYPQWVARTLETHDLDAEPGSIHASVVDEAGNPVAGASVLLDGESTARGTSADDGSATLADLPSGIYTARASKDGFFSPPQNVHVVDRTVQEVKLVIPNVELVVYPDGGDSGDGLEEIDVQLGQPLELHWRVRGDFEKLELTLAGQSAVGVVNGRTFETGEVDVGFAPLTLRDDLLQPGGGDDGKKLAEYMLKVTRKGGASDGPQRVKIHVAGALPNQKFHRFP